MTEHSEFARVRKEGASKAGKYWVIGTLEAADLDYVKVGFITTKKVGKAHDRVTIRRRARVILQKYLSQVTDKRYIVTVARWNTAAADYQQLEHDWAKTARRLGILPKNQITPN